MVANKGRESAYEGEERRGKSRLSSEEFFRTDPIDDLSRKEILLIYIGCEK